MQIVTEIQKGGASAAPIRVQPPLDPSFRPVGRARRALEERIRTSGLARPVTLAVEQPGGTVSRHATVAWPDGHPEAAHGHHHAERLLKTLLWARGGSRVHLDGPDGLVAYLRRHYAEDPAGIFDARIAAEIYLRPLELCTPRRRKIPLLRRVDRHARWAPGWVPHGLRPRGERPQIRGRDRRRGRLQRGGPVGPGEPRRPAVALRRDRRLAPPRGGPPAPGRCDRRQRRRSIRRQPGARRLALPVRAPGSLRYRRAGPLRRPSARVGRRPLRGRQRRRGDGAGRLDDGERRRLPRDRAGLQRGGRLRDP